MKIEKSQTLPDSLEKISINKMKNNFFFGTDGGEDFENNFFHKLPKQRQSKRYSRHSSKSEVFHEGYERKIRNIPKKPRF